MKTSQIAYKYPTFRDEKLKSSLRWLDGKKIDDNAEGLWRVHDKLYDFSDFIVGHPGGSDWLEVTRGVDITEQFETHHIRGLAEKILPKYFIRNASLPRNYKITFDEKGFYRTLKRRVALKFDTFDQSPATNSRFYCDFMLTSMILLSTIAAREENYLIGLLASIALFCLTEITHNYIHQKSNWRMYLINFSGGSYRDWRIYHAMSHHLYPNSFHDLEISFFEPFLNWIPKEKSLLVRYGAWLSPLAYPWQFIFISISRTLYNIMQGQKFYWDDLVTFTLPAVMFFFGNSNLLIVLKLWTFMIFVASFLHGCIAINAGHHDETIFHDGDELKSLDFGIYQLSATIDKLHVKKSLFLTLTTFGNHVLHHMFPTLDHAVLPQLHEILISTCKEFECEMREYSWWKLVIGQFNQLARTERRKVT